MKISRTRITNLIKSFESRYGAKHGMMKTSDARFLLTAAAFLNHWHEHECGNSQTCIRQDDEGTYWKDYANGRPSHKIRDTYTPRVQSVTSWAKEKGMHVYIQTDPRGAAIYLHSEPMKDGDYSRGLAIC